MKKIIFFLLFAQNVFSQSKITIKNSNGGSGGSNAIGNQFDIRKYGADTSLADNSTAIQNAINAAHHYGQVYKAGTLKGVSGGGVVSIPAGIFKTKKLTTYEDVKIQGEGYITSQLKSIQADTLLVIHMLNDAISGTPFNAFTNTLIEDVVLAGDSIGTVGFYCDRIANFRIGRIIVKEFTSKGMILRNSLIGVVDGCYFFRNPTGVLGFADGTNNTATNHVVFRDCTINLCNKWAIDWSGGGVVKVDHGDMEGNGTSGDTLTGSVFYHNNAWPGGLTLDNCWFEENLGTNICIMNNNIGQFSPGAPTTNVNTIINCQDLGQQYNFTVRNIYIQGVGNQRISIVSSVVQGAANTVVADGPVKINVLGTNIPSSIMRGGATITTVGN